MHSNWKLVMAGAVCALAGACSDDTGRETGPVTQEPAAGRERLSQTAPAESTGPTGMPATNVAAPTVTAAIAQLRPTEGNSVQGTVRFTLASAGLASAEMDGTGIHISGTVQGLGEGKHGFHVHEFGDCSTADGSSAGGHFNPENKPHGGPDAQVRHVGDLGNIDAGGKDAVNLDLRDDRISLSGDRSIIGRALVVHANPDDLKSQPSGDAGARVACGVIGIAGNAGGAATATSTKPAIPGDEKSPGAGGS